MMTPFIALIAIALLAGCATTSEPPRQSYPVEAVALTSLVCKGETAILELADADARSHEQGINAFRRLRREESCGTLQPPRPLPLTEMILEYRDYSGKRTQVRRIAGSDYFTLFIIGEPETRGSRYQPVHGDAEWIQNHPKHSWCCGVDDCHRLEDRAVTRRGNEYVVRWQGDVFTYPIREALPSIDADYWGCIRGSTLICLFQPNLGA